MTAWRQGASIIPPAVTAAGFVLLPPLLAFGLYFGLVHSPRHLLRLGAWHDPADPRRAARWAAAVVVPASLVCALGIIGIALTTQDVSIGILVPTFRIIAALTLPHMIVTSWLGAARVPALEAGPLPGTNIARSPQGELKKGLLF